MAQRKKRGFGQLRQLPSDRVQAFYTGPDLAMHYAPSTFDTWEDAEGWLSDERKLIAADAWTPPKYRTDLRPLTLAEYAEEWMQDADLKPKTRSHYRRLLDRFILPELGAVPLRLLNTKMIKAWHRELDDSTPTLKAHTYGLLRAILSGAVADDDVSLKVNPCTIKGAGSAKRVKRIQPASLTELETIVTNMPERLQLMVLLAAWCAMRSGELRELRRKDVDVKAGTITVERAVVHVDGEWIVGPPKSDAGERTIHIPPHLLPAIKAHLAGSISGGRNGLLFPAADGVSHLAESTLYGKAPRKGLNGKTIPGHGFYGARAAAGRDDLRFHDLRHTGATLAAQTGATTAELMARLGHGTQAAAMIYQHAAKNRDLVIAENLSKLATASE